MTDLAIVSRPQNRFHYSMLKTVLILGGTGDARLLADRLVEQRGDYLRVITSLAGRTSSPRRPMGEIREGGFGGPEGLAKYLKDTPVDVLVDATHPYAAQISKHAVSAATTAGIPHLLLSRPEWSAEPNDKWHHVSNIEVAANALNTAQVALITTGVQNLDAFADVYGPQLLVRLIEQPKSPLPIDNAKIVIGRPPYTMDGERALFKLLGIDTLVTKNAGGEATVAKIDAARALGIQVIMIDRPPLPRDAHVVEDIEQAQNWVLGELSLA